LAVLHRQQSFFPNIFIVVEFIIFFFYKTIILNSKKNFDF
jgi:hypothetical protein